MSQGAGFDSGVLRGLPFQLSVEDIDHLLTSDADISRSSLWVPQRVAHADPAGFGHERGVRQGGPPPRGAAALGRHAIPGSEAFSGDCTATPAPVSIEMGPPGDQGQMPPAQSYGTVHAGAAGGEGSLPLKYKRIEKVALTIGMLCSTVFVVSLCGDGQAGSASSSSSSLAGSQNTVTKLGASCSSFLCPDSGHCVASAGACPEGNPFLKAKSAYRDLIDCAAATHLCDEAVGAATVSFTDKTVATALAAEGSVNGKFKACDGFLCPMSGACKVSPVNCTEGDPFTKHTSLYWKEALAAKALLHHPAAVHAKSAAAPTKATSGHGSPSAGAGGTKELHAGTQAAGSKVAAGKSRAKAPKAAASAVGGKKKLTAKQLEAQEVKSEAKSLEKADAAIAASIYDHSKPVSSKAAARAGRHSSAEKLLSQGKAHVTHAKPTPQAAPKEASQHVAAAVKNAPRPPVEHIPAAAG